MYGRDARRYHWVSKSFATESLLPYVVHKRASSGNLSADSHSDLLEPSVDSLLVGKQCLLTQSLFLVSCWPWSSFTHVLMLNSYLHMMNGGIRSVVARDSTRPWYGLRRTQTTSWTPSIVRGTVSCTKSLRNGAIRNRKGLNYAIMAHSGVLAEHSEVLVSIHDQTSTMGLTDASVSAMEIQRGSDQTADRGRSPSKPTSPQMEGLTGQVYLCFLSLRLTDVFA